MKNISVFPFMVKLGIISKKVKVNIIKRRITMDITEVEKILNNNQTEIKDLWRSL